MSTNTPAPVIVMTEEKKRRKGLVWVAGGAALLLGGSTFALWSASDTFAGGTITAGDLNLVQTADTTFWDVSADRIDATATVLGTDGSQPAHALTPTDASTWRMVPGDKVAAAFSADVTLEGDNLVGLLSLDGLDDITSGITGMSYSYEVYQDGDLVVQETALPTAANAPLLYLSAPATGQEGGAEDANASGAVVGGTAATTVFSMTEKTEDFTVVIYGSFFVDGDGDFTYSDETLDSTVTERTDVSLSDTLAELTLSLQQARDTGAQFTS
jgi:alternate signal-mediated exported protein